MKNENIAFYLKYRPQTLEDLVGQESVKKNLLSAFQNNKLSHAYLLVGPRGIGKTSTARILAKMVNCELVQSSELVVGSKQSLQPRLKDKNSTNYELITNNYPCNKCATCISITDGSNLDLIEIDAASNRGIEDIRALREKIKLSPSSGKKKVYIVDEVHMLTTEAFNALLKTLEEPPKHALFILATTEVNKIPATILSRVQRLDFKPATSEELLEALQKITKAEKIDIDEAALKLLIKKSDGSFRDGVKLLDQVSTMEGKITLLVLEKFFKSSNFEIILKLLQELFRKDTKGALTLVVKEIEDGIDIKEFILFLMQTLRSIVFIRNNLGDQLVKENYSNEDYLDLVKLAESFENQDLVKNLNSLQNALEKMKTTSIPSLPLELAVVEICNQEEKLDISSEKFEKEVVSLKLEENTQASEGLVSNIQIQDPASSFQHPSTNESPDISKLKEKWTFVLETVRPYNFSLEALLRSVNITECSMTQVLMEVPYSFHQRILEAPKNRDLLESILSEILGRPIRVSTVLGLRPKSREDIANIEVAADDEIIRAAAEIFSSEIN